MQNVRVHCRTNLDLSSAESWPEYLPCRPAVGDRIMSRMAWHPHATEKTQGVPIHLELEVCAVSFEPAMVRDEHGRLEPSIGYDVIIELHLPRTRFESLHKFESWYRWLQGKA